MTTYEASAGKKSSSPKNRSFHFDSVVQPLDLGQVLLLDDAALDLQRRCHQSVLNRKCLWKQHESANTLEGRQIALQSFQIMIDRHRKRDAFDHRLSSLVRRNIPDALTRLCEDV